jgi:hypothetical protein
MKKSILITILGIFVAGATFAQSEEIRRLSSFSKIKAQEAVEVILKQGDKEEARVVTERYDLEEVLTDVSGGTLKIHLEGSNHRNVDVRVYVTYRSLEALDASSAASIKSEDFIETIGRFDVDLSSSGSVNAKIKADELTFDASSSGNAVLELEVDEIRADLSSAGSAKLSGTARSQTVDASSAGSYSAFDLVCETAKTNVSSAGSISVHVNQNLKARASSGGSIRYKGSPEYLDSSSSSGGSIRAR